MQIFNEIAIVESNKMIAKNIYEARLFSPLIASSSKPGQFINILPKSNWSYIMRRPMSVSSQNNKQIEIIYKVFGEGTKIISEWKEKDKIDIIGPLGNFWNNYDNLHPILIGGGVGIAPIINLHNKFNSLKIKHTLIVGARDKEEHFINHNPEKNIFLTTDNEDYGIKGNVVNALKLIHKNSSYDDMKVFTCGPHGMIKGVDTYCRMNNLDCDFALETIMACGIGICQGCTIVRNNDNSEYSYRKKFALACIDGPIFNIKDLDKNAL